MRLVALLPLPVDTLPPPALLSFPHSRTSFLSPLCALPPQIAILHPAAPEYASKAEAAHINAKRDKLRGGAGSKAKASLKLPARLFPLHVQLLCSLCPAYGMP